MRNPQTPLKKRAGRVKVARMIRRTPLARYRFEQGITMRELAERASRGGNVQVTAMTISRVERGTFKALAVLARISKVTGLSGDDLLAGGERR